MQENMQKWIPINYRQSSSGISKIKYSLPEDNNQRIVRHRLIDQLNRAMNVKFMLVQAPAGYGKTTAVTDWVKTLDRRVIWFSVGEEDNSTKVFWKSLLYPLSEIIPEIFDSASELYLLPEDDIHSELVDIIIQNITNIQETIVLILDDLHLIKNPIIFQGIASLIKRLPENLKMIFISRESLPFPVVKYKASGQFVEILFTDLIFTKDELKDLLNDSEMKFTQNEVEAIAIQNEGWITGIQIMMMENRQGKKNIRHFILEEVLTDQDEELLYFLQGTSIFDAFCASLCDAIFECTNSYAMIQKIKVKNAFIFSLDEEDRWYRYHHLFLDTLRNQQQKMSPDLIKKLHARAAAWFEQNGMIENAIDYYLIATEIPQAVSLIEKVAPIFIAINDFDKIMKWIKELPVDIVERNYVLCLINTWYYQLDTQFEKTFEKAWEYIVKAEKAYNAMLRNETISHTALESAKADILHFKVVYGMLSCDFPVFMKASAEISEVNTSNTIFAKNGLEFNRAQPTLIFLLFENLELFVDNVLLQTIQRLKNQKIRDLSYGYVLYGEMLYEFNEMDKALPLLTEGGLIALAEGKYGAFLPGVNTTAKVYWAKGEYKKALTILLEGEQKLAELNKVFLSKKMKTFRMWLLIMNREMDIVNVWMRENFEDNPMLINIQNEFDLSVYARGLIENRKYGQAEVLLLRLVEFADRLKQIRWTIIFHNILARMYYKKANYEKAMSCLKIALNYGLKHKYFRIFIEEGTLMAQLLDLFLRTEHTKVNTDMIDYVKIIKDSLTDDINKHITNYVPLTSAEITILSLIREGKTNEEIANRLSVQVDTIKKHLSSIYRKLGVKNRTQAIWKAEENQVLDK